MVDGLAVLSSETSAAAALVQRAAKGDRAAFTALVEVHSSSMARLAFAICADSEVARDAVQGAWAIAWRKLDKLRDEERIHSWLLTIAANEARRLVRRQRIRREAERRAVASRAAEHHDSPTDYADLANALQRIDAHSRELLGLRYGLGMNSSEIAAQLGCSAGSVRVRLMRLLGRLRKELDDA